MRSLEQILRGKGAFLQRVRFTLFKQFTSSITRSKSGRNDKGYEIASNYLFFNRVIQFTTVADIETSNL